jgi:hypothetical protein
VGRGGYLDGLLHFVYSNSEVKFRKLYPYL